MKSANKSMYVDAIMVAQDWGCSRAKAYRIIKELNCQLREAKPYALIVAGKVNRRWYDEVCLTVK